MLIADAEVESGRATARALDAWGLQTLLVHDGVEAILSIQRALPRAVVLDAALPKMFGFEICELMKRNESLRHIHVVLVGAIHDRDRYRRPPSELYGADAYVERPQMPDELRPILREFGLALGEARPTRPSTAAPAVAAPAPSQARVQARVQAREAGAQRAAGERRSEAPGAQRAAGERRSEAPGAQRAAGERRSEAPGAQRAAGERRWEAPGARRAAGEQRSEAPGAQRAEPEGRRTATDLDPIEVEKAERLARIVISDIVLYNPEKFEAALAAGEVLEGMANELEEGRGLLRQRIGARVLESRDFLAQELLRVAEQRGMK